MRTGRPRCAQRGKAMLEAASVQFTIQTAKYEPGTAPAAATRTDRQDRRIVETEWRPESLTLAQEIKAHAAARGLPPGQFAVA